MELLPFFLILLTTVLFAAAFRRFHLPWVLALISAGVVIGPHGLSIAEVNPTMDFLSQIGLIFLMFMAGLEIKFSSFKKYQHDIIWLAALSGLIPFVAGIGLGYAFGFPLIPSLLMGIIFMSSSIAVIIPTLESYRLSDKKLGQLIIATTIVVDVISLVLLSILLQVTNPVTELPLYSFYFLVTLAMIGFTYALPKIRALIPIYRNEKDLFESEVRVIFALLIGVVITFELLGLHPIIASFFAGLMLSDTIKSELLIDKLRTISYGIFIPVFFVVVGMETDLDVFAESSNVLALIIAIVVVSTAAKFFSGWLGGYMLGFSRKDSSIIGLSTIPQLSTTLAVVYTAIASGLLPSMLATAMVILSLVTTFLAPLGLKYLAEPK